MPTSIHKTACIDPAATIGSDVTIGPFCVVGPDAVIGDGVAMHNHVVIDGYTEIGAGCEIFPFAVLGCPPQHTSYANEPSRLRIGQKCQIREHVTIHPGTAIDKMETVVGDNVVFCRGACGA